MKQLLPLEADGEPPSYSDTEGLSHKPSLIPTMKSDCKTSLCVKNATDAYEFRWEGDREA